MAGHWEHKDCLSSSNIHALLYSFHYYKILRYVFSLLFSLASPNNAVYRMLRRNGSYSGRSFFEKFLLNPCSFIDEVPIGGRFPHRYFVCRIQSASSTNRTLIYIEILFCYPTPWSKAQYL